MKRIKFCAAFVAAMVFSVVQAPAQVTGTGTKGTIPVWAGTTKLGNSGIVQSGGNVGIGTKKPGAKLDVLTTSKKAPAITGSTSTSTNYVPAIYGVASATTGDTVGVLGQSYSPTGVGVNGSVTAASGQTVGVY